jgi:hypothetical protein
MPSAYTADCSVVESNDCTTEVDGNTELTTTKPLLLATKLAAVEPIS